jgi:uncharacterized membrane protein YczE
MTKIKKSSELVWLLGTIFVSLGVALCNKSDLGVSMIAAPGFIISEALLKINGFFTAGVTSYLFQGALLIILCIVIRGFNWRFLLAFVAAIICGYTLDLFIWICSPLVVEELWLKWAVLLIGDIATAFGVACFFRTYLPLQVYELFVAQISDSFGFKLPKVKLSFDLCLLTLSIILALTLFGDATAFDWSSFAYKSYHSIGLGTIVTTFINSPIIAMFLKLIDRVFDNTPLFPKLKSVLNHGAND